MKKQKKRGRGKISQLPQAVRDTVEQMILITEPYHKIVQYLKEQSYSISASSVYRYADRYLASVNDLKHAQENMHMMMEEMDKFPNLDAAEAILRVASNQVFNAITAVPEDGWEQIDPEKLLRQATGLARVAVYKKRIDQQVKTETEATFDAGQSLIFDVIAKKHPDLYEQLSKIIKEEKKLAQGESS